MKFPHSGIRRSARPFGKMDKTTTRAMAKREKVKANTLISDPDDTKTIDKDETKVSQEIKHNMVHKYKNNSSLSLKDKMKKMFIFLLGSMGSNCTLFNSGGLPVCTLGHLTMPGSNYDEDFEPEYKIKFHDRSL